jgi:hypothetical protein
MFWLATNPKSKIGSLKSKRAFVPFLANQIHFAQLPELKTKRLAKRKN